MITDATPGLTFGALNFFGSREDGDPYWFSVAGEDQDFGNPEAMVRAITSFLMDGAIEETDSYGNREMTFKICLEGEDSYALGDGEKAWFNEVRKGRNELVWTPPNIITGYGEKCVFDVVNAIPFFDFDDLEELRLTRNYRLTIKALPFARSDTLIEIETTPPVATTPVNTLVDNCSALTGWSTLASPGFLGSVALNSTSGVINASVGWPASASYRSLNLVRTGLSESLASTPFVRVKVTVNVSGGMDASSVVVRASFNGQPLINPIAHAGDYYWYAPGVATVTSLNLYHAAKSAKMAGSIGVHVDELHRTDTTSLSTLAGQRQQFVALPVEGSARTQGNLTVKSAASALGQTLVYTNRDISGFQPDLRRRMLAGPTETTDSSVVSGKTSPLSTSHSFVVQDVPPSGYVLYARVKHASAGAYALSWSADVVPVGSPSTPYLGTVGQTGTTIVDLAAGAWTILPVAKMVLPTSVLAEGGATRVTLSGPSGVVLDEAWLFDVDNGRLSQADLGSGSPAVGGPYNELRLLAASLDNPAPSAVVSGDGTNLIGAGGMMESLDAHECVPDLMNVFFVTSESVTSFIRASYYDSYFSHVAKVS